MNGESGAAPALDLRAVGVGVLWGIGTLLVGSIIQGMIGYNLPGVEALLPLFWHALASLLCGLQAARRASGSGWLHGAVSGIALVLCLAAGMGVAAGLPTLAVLMKMLGIGAGAGILGGIAGVNLSR